MLCRFVFAFWWSMFVAGIWFHLHQPLHVWTVDRHEAQRIHVTKTFQPIKFDNTSVLWIDMLKDSVHLELRTTMPGHNVSIDTAKMHVYENSFRDTTMEVYEMQFHDVDIESAHLNLVQDDVHLSPYRSIHVWPQLSLNISSTEEPDFYRAGHFKDGKWYEGRDSTQLGFGALFAWCMGVVFLVVMRRKSGTVVVTRKKRIFK